MKAATADVDKSDALKKVRDRVVGFERLRAGDLKPHPQNFRTHPKQQRAALKGLLGELGFAGAVLVRKIPGGHQILDGHLRAETLPDQEVPCLVLDLNDAEAAKLISTFDPLGTMAGASTDALAALLREFSTADDAVARLLASTAKAAGIAPAGVTEDEAPPPPANPKSKTGDLWLLGPHRLICGSSTDPATVKRVLNGEEPRLMLTDPPYGVSLDMEWRDNLASSVAPAEPSYMQRKAGHKNTTISGDTQADWSPAFELVPSLDTIYVWHADRFTVDVGLGLRRIGFDLKQLIVWRKSILVLSRTHYHSQHEDCWYARKTGSLPFLGARDQSTVWDAASPKCLMSGSKEEKIDHPTQKPVVLYTRPIENHLKKGELFYEPFGGSGTAIAAAEQTGRRCFCVELDPKYVDVIVSRWQRLTGKKAVNETRPKVVIA